MNKGLWNIQIRNNCLGPPAGKAGFQMPVDSDCSWYFSQLKAVDHMSWVSCANHFSIVCLVPSGDVAGMQSQISWYVGFKYACYAVSVAKENVDEGESPLLLLLNSWASSSRLENPGQC